MIINGGKKTRKNKTKLKFRKYIGKHTRKFKRIINTCLLVKMFAKYWTCFLYRCLK